MSDSKLGVAIALAAERHMNMVDRGGNPYILHCLKVMEYLHSEDDDLKCIAVLHDIVEDTETTFGELTAFGFSDRVTRAINCLTKRKDQTPEQYLTSILSNVDAMRVKLCDLRHNSDIRRLKGLTEKDFERIQKYHKMYMIIFDKLKSYQLLPKTVA
jgi:(p)ppGpp synthase/HD superfamily hydrolase